MGSERYLCPEEINQKMNQIVGVTLKRGRSNKALRPKPLHHLDSALKLTAHIKLSPATGLLQAQQQILPQKQSTESPVNYI